MLYAKKIISYGLHWDAWLLREYQNKTLICNLHQNHDTVEIFNYKKKMILKFNYV